MKGKDFHFLRWFSALSFVSIVFISTVSAILLSRFLTHNILQRDAVVTMGIVQSLLKINEATLYFSGMTHQETEAAFQVFLEPIVEMPEVVRSNVYDLEGSIIWSNDARFIGHNFMPNPELIRAISGNLAISSGESGKPIKGEHVFDEKVPLFAEIYIPIWNKKVNRVVGVVEIYKVPLQLLSTIRGGNRLIWMSTFLGGIFLYFTLFWIARRANHVIVSQQDQLLESETMVVVGEMASAVAHGIQNPLASIRSSAEIALEEDSPDTFLESLQDIIREADRLAGWIRELLSYANVSSGVLTTISLNDFLRSTINPFKNEMDRKDIKITYNLENSEPIIEADEVPLRQLFVSLIANALEAMPEGGELFISNRLFNKNSEAEIKIQDNGMGISKEEMKRIFKPFFTTKKKGIGVGLSLAKRIIERHRGTIKLLSREGQGTTVLLHLPAMK